MGCLIYFCSEGECAKECGRICNAILMMLVKKCKWWWWCGKKEQKSTLM